MTSVRVACPLAHLAEAGQLRDLLRTTGCESLPEAAAAAAGGERPFLAVDGKTAGRSHDRGKGLGAVNCVSVWASDFGLSLG